MNRLVFGGSEHREPLNAVTGVLAADREAVFVRPPSTPQFHLTSSRTRRRGPRSDAAVLRRSQAHPAVS